MKDLLLEFLNNYWALLTSIAPYIFMGILLAGIFKHYLPEAFIKKHLGQRGFLSSIKAAILGIPLPLCSCSVIPFISALKQSGASKSAIQTFLIATPITGADSILASYGVFGWFFTAYRLISSIIISLIAGLLTTLFAAEFDESTITSQPKKGHAQSKLSAIRIAVNTPKTKPTAVTEIMQILSYAFDDILKDFAKSLMIGVVLGAVIMTIMPSNLAQLFSDMPIINYLVIILFSLPLYICATASIPLALSILSAGFSPGAAFILLTAGPATNMITLNVVLNTLGKTSLFIYLSSVMLGSLTFGYIFDTFFAEQVQQLLEAYNHQESIGFISQISAVILFYLSIKLSLKNSKPIIKAINEGGCSGGCCSNK